MAPKAPSEGTKVYPGQEAPIKNEPAGTVPPGSLAAESYSNDGEFSKNTGTRSKNLSHDQLKSSQGASKFDPAPDADTREAMHDTTSNTAASYDVATGSGQSASKSNTGSAPTYVADQYIRDQNGPHGSNITEGFDDSGTKDGLKEALNAEPGSIQDPSRSAERELDLKKNTRTRAAGPHEHGTTEETKYDALRSDVSA